ncbi:FAD-binding domain-containing protein [Lentithecium fluviatile CBS 122367]|uniref:FAD-binding domain-containing protein n=1 Tax=Lentithecium fluviatile CBS 122367 TaxID=1168545 RepID=A0A6G1IEL8_9PLEO|nr:FAD-binding domain-containing protein [Lentithecium fluviatile CBS 122367]
MASSVSVTRVLLWVAAPLLFGTLVTQYRDSLANTGSLQCAALSLALWGKVSYPDSSTYEASISSYWSLQEASLSPSCVVKPTSAFDVSIAIKTISFVNIGLSCDFAIRGGGHTPWASSANIEKGVTIDMSAIKSVVFNKDKSIASVGAGAVWGDVYRTVDAAGLAVIGGRGATIGVGGLTTGGGISYFSARKGFACDNVANYEIVLANGNIVNANSKENADLWLALKGGSNNFGVVTRFDLKTFKQGKFWGGSILYGDDASPALIQAFSDLNKATGYDEYAALIQSFSYVSGGVGFVVAANIEYTKEGVENPATFQPFTAAQPQFINSMRTSNLTDFTVEQMYITTTFKSQLAFLQSAYSNFKSISPQLSAVPNLSFSWTIQPIPPALTSKSAPLGGNMLGLDPSEGALVLGLISATWDTAADDELVYRVGKQFYDNIVSEAKSKGLYNDWIYLNYASKWQDPIGGYGVENKKKLQAASRKYDPSGLFQKHVPGGFKLF